MNNDYNEQILNDSENGNADDTRALATNKGMNYGYPHSFHNWNQPSHNHGYPNWHGNVGHSYGWGQPGFQGGWNNHPYYGNAGFYGYPGAYGWNQQGFQGNWHPHPYYGNTGFPGMFGAGFHQGPFQMFGGFPYGALSWLPWF